MDEEEYEVVVVESLPARRLHKWDAAILGLSLIHDVMEAVTANIHTAIELLAMQENYEVAQDQFREAVALDIETITKED